MFVCLIKKYQRIEVLILQVSCFEFYSVALHVACCVASVVICACWVRKARFVWLRVHKTKNVHMYVCSRESERKKKEREAENPFSGILLLLAC